MEFEPVQIEWGNFETLTTVAELAQCLMYKWPVRMDGEAYVTALMVCSAVLTGWEDDKPEHARAAFVEAVSEAGLSLREDDSLDWL